MVTAAIRVRPPVVLVQLEARGALRIDLQRHLVQRTLAGVLHDRTQRQDRAAADQEWQPIERRLDRHAAGPFVALARPEVEPGSAWQVDRPGRGALPGHRRHQQIVTPQVLMVERPRSRIVRIVQDERTHQRQAQRVGLPGQRVRIGQEPIAQLGVATADGLDLGAVGPGHVLAPHPAVRAEDRAERTELEPARVELGGLGDRMKEPADVRAPVGNTRQPRVQPQRDLSVQRREVVVDVAGPGRRPEPLHSGGPGTAQEEGTLLGTRGRLAVGERLVTEAIVDVVQGGAASAGQRRGGRRSFAAVEPPAAHAEPDEVAMRRPPPRAHRRVREIEMALPLTIVRNAAGAPLVARRQEVATRLGLVEQRRGLVQDRILVGDELEMLSPHLVEQCGRLGPEIGLELQMPHPAVPALGLAIAREIDERVARNPLLADGAGQAAKLCRVVEVARRLEEAERPTWRHRRSPEEIGHLAHEGAQVGTDEEVPGQRAGLGRVVDPHAVVRAPHRQDGLARIVEEQRVAATGDQQRDPDVRARPVAQVRVPELAGLAEAVEAAAALPQTVEVLLARKREPRANARRAVRPVLDGHSAVVGLTQQPRAGRVAEGEAQRFGLDVESEITGRETDDLTVGDLEWRRRPAPRSDVGDLRRRARAQRDAHDPRATDRHRNRPGCAGEDQCRVSTLEARPRAGA